MKESVGSEFNLVVFGVRRQPPRVLRRNRRLEFNRFLRKPSKYLVLQFCVFRSQCG